MLNAINSLLTSEDHFADNRQLRGYLCNRRIAHATAELVDLSIRLEICCRYCCSPIRLVRVKPAWDITPVIQGGGRRDTVHWTDEFRGLRGWPSATRRFGLYPSVDQQDVTYAVWRYLNIDPGGTIATGKSTRRQYCHVYDATASSSALLIASRPSAMPTSSCACGHLRSFDSGVSARRGLLSAAPFRLRDSGSTPAGRGLGRSWLLDRRRWLAVSNSSGVTTGILPDRQIRLYQPVPNTDR